MVTDMQGAQQFIAEVQSGQSLLDVLLAQTGLPEAVLLDAAEKGALWVSLQRGKGRTKPRRTRSLDTVVEDGSTVMLNYHPSVLAAVPQDIHCVSDHVNYGIWFKPSGMLCQGSKWSDHTIAPQVASRQRQGSCFIVHRLDRAACGLLVLAYTKNALRALTSLFEQRAINKHYQATVHGQFDKPLPLQIDTPIETQSAKTVINTCHIDEANNTSVLSLSIETGRKHQIRRHLCDIGYPIVGDRLYDKTRDREAHTANLQLVANQIQFTCPFTSQPVDVAIDASDALAGHVAE